MTPALLPEEVRISPTQVEAWERCNRYWWFKWGWKEKLTEPQRGYQLFGTILHEVIERFLMSDSLGRVPQGTHTEGRFKGQTPGQPTNLYPDGWDAQLSNQESALIKKLVAKAIEDGIIVRTPGLRCEVEMNRPVLNQGNLTVIVTGRIDVIDPEGIEDHKSTKDMRYAKKPEELRTNIQLLMYAMEFIQQRHEQGLPMPAKIKLCHNVYCKDPTKQVVRKTKTEVSPEEVLAQWDTILTRIIPNMLEVRKLVHWQTVPGPMTPAKTCNEYGGCAFRGICTEVQSVENYRKINPAKGATAPSVFSEPTTKKETQTMSLSDRLAKRAPPVSTAPQQINPTPPSMPAKEGGPFAAPIKQSKSLPTRTAIEEAKTLPSSDALAQRPLPKGTIQAPWGVPTCGSCKGVGFDAQVNPCRVCVALRRSLNGILPEMFDISTSEDGQLKWTPKPDRLSDLADRGYVVEERAQVLAVPDKQVKTKEVVETVEEEAEEEEVEFVEEVKFGGAEQAPAPSTSVAPTKRGPGRPKKGESVVLADIAAPLVKTGFVLMLGCSSRQNKNKQVYIEEIVHLVGGEIAKTNGLPSYFSGDVWKRRDALAAMAQAIASNSIGKVIVVRRLTTDIEPLVYALCALAQDVFEADSFHVKPLA